MTHHTSQTDTPPPADPTVETDAGRDARRLAIGIGTSVIVHLVVAGALVLAPAAPAAAERSSQPPPGVDPPEPLPLTPLGIERSTATTMNWVGFEEYREHLAPEGPVDQAELSRAPGTPGQPSPAASPPPPPPEPTPPEPILPDPVVAEPSRVETAAPPLELPLNQPTPAPPMPADLEAEPMSDVDQPEVVAGSQVVDTPPPPTPDDVEPATDVPDASIDAQRSADAPAGELPQPSPPQPTSPPQPDQPQAEPPQPQQRPSDQAPPATAPGGGGEAPGEVSEKESDAAAIEAALEIVPGRPLAAEGLEITTRRPRFATTTLLTANPRSPVVLVTFGRDGSVIRARFAEDDDTLLDTGYEDVNQPLLDAIYLWRAKGVALRAIPADDPDAGVTIPVRITWSGM